MSVPLRRIECTDALFLGILAEAVADDGSFLQRRREEWLRGFRYAGAGEILLGAFSGKDLVAVGGVCADPYQPRQALGRIRHVYVLKAYRGRGLGRMIVERLIEHSLEQFQVLRLKTENPIAAKLYEKPWVRSVEPWPRDASVGASNVLH